MFARSQRLCRSQKTFLLCNRLSHDDPIISSSRTDTTASLWKKRVEKDLLDEAKKKSLEKQNASGQPSFLVKKSPSESLVSIDLDFKSNPSLVEQYQSWNKQTCRLGKVLEDLDALAGNISHTHADDNNPQTRPLHIVTACVDRIDVLRPFPLHLDLTMQGSVGYVGRSSMQINVEVIEKEIPENKILRSSFLMVARDESTGKSTPVNHLDIQTDDEKRNWIEGEEAKAIRKKERSISLLKTPPTTEEMEMIHQMHLNSSEIGVKSVNISDTVMSSVIVTQPQEKNTKEKIFGGYLMRKAYELSMATALKFCGSHSRPILLAVDEITFHRPVEIGSLITFEASVIYTTNKACQMKVETRIHDLVKDEQHKSNSFHFTFATNSDNPIPKVKPNTYQETIDYIDGKRRLQSSKEFAEKQQSTLFDNYL